MLILLAQVQLNHHHLLKFNSCICDLCSYFFSKSIADKKENKSKVTALKNSKQLLDYLNKTYHTFTNVHFLQGLFLASKAPELYEICLKYAKTREKTILFFEKQILENGKDLLI